MKKINVLLLLVFLLGIKSLFAIKIPLNGTTCKDFGINGNNSACVGNNMTFEINHEGQKTINWTVTKDLMEIVSISGINIASYLADMNIPDGIGITQVYVESEYAAVSFNGSFSFQSDIKGVPTNINVAANTLTDATQFPILRDLFSNVQITGNSIVVRTLKPGYAQVSASATEVPGQAAVGGGLFMCYSSVSASKNVQISGAELPQTISFTSNQDLNAISCNQTANISIPYIKHVGDFTYNWSVSSGGQVLNSSINNANFKFNGKGEYTIYYEATDHCGTKKVYSRNVNVDYEDSQILLEGSVIANNEIVLNCNQAKGFNLTIEPWLSDEAEYEWHLPAGWIIEGRSPSRINSVNGMRQYAYKGNNLRYARIKSFNPNAETGGISIQISKVCGDDEVTKTVNLIAPLNISVQLLTNSISCESSIDLSPIISDAVPPYKVNWTTALNGNFSNGRSYSSNVVENNFTAQTFSNGSITVNVEDSRGCSNRATTNVSLFGGNNPEDMNISGWLSGHINPNQRAEVASNLSMATDFDRVYFVRNLNGTRQVWFYQFDLATSSWLLKNANITDLLANGENPIHYIKSGASNDYLFYVNAQGNLEVALIDRTTGQTNGISSDFKSISPRENNSAYSYAIEDINGSLVRVLWKSILGDLHTQIIVFDPIGGRILLDDASYKLLVSNNDLTTIVRFDVDKQRNRIFYFKNDGGFYTQSLLNLGEETKLNGVLTDDQVWDVTDLVFDNEGNVYFTANGDLFFVAFDVNENYIATYKIETTDGVLTDQLKSGAKGYLAINRSTNVLYYAGYNNNMYQAYRDANFNVNKQFHIVRATPESFQDKVSSSLIYQDPHLFYRGTDNQVFNLFYIDIAQVATCKPKWLREGIAEEMVDATLLEPATSGRLSGRLYPNPTTGNTTVDVWGGKNEGVLEVFDMKGTKLFESTYGFDKQELNMINYTQGVYLVRVNDGESTISLKVIKE